MYLLIFFMYYKIPKIALHSKLLLKNACLSSFMIDLMLSFAEKSPFLCKVHKKSMYKYNGSHMFILFCIKGIQKKGIMFFSFRVPAVLSPQSVLLCPFLLAMLRLTIKVLLNLHSWLKLVDLIRFEKRFVIV